MVHGTRLPQAEPMPPGRWPRRSFLQQPLLKRPGRRQSERGIILFTALWTLSLLSLMAVGLMMVSRTDRLLSRNALAAVRADLAAEAGIAGAIAALVARNPNDPWPIDGTPRTLEIDGSEVKVAIQEELGKLDINYTSETLLSDFFVGLGLGRQKASAIADAIADWRDADDAKRLNGAEAADYRAAGLGYGPRDARYETLEELLLVLGVTEEILEQARSHLTIYSQRPQVNVQTATPVVRMTLAGGSQAQSTISTPVTTNELANLTGQAFGVSAAAKGGTNAPTLRRTTVRFMGGPKSAFVVLE